MVAARVTIIVRIEPLRIARQCVEKQKEEDVMMHFYSAVTLAVAYLVTISFSVTLHRGAGARRNFL